MKLYMRYNFELKLNSWFLCEMCVKKYELCVRKCIPNLNRCKFINKNFDEDFIFISYVCIICEHMIIFRSLYNQY